MEIEVLLERLIQWLDVALSDPQSVSVIDQSLTALDQWLKADIAAKQSGITPAGINGAVGMPGVTGVESDQPLPRSARGKQPGTTGMVV